VEVIFLKSRNLYANTTSNSLELELAREKEREREREREREIKITCNIYEANKDSRCPNDIREPL